MRIWNVVPAIVLGSFLAGCAAEPAPPPPAPPQLTGAETDGEKAVIAHQYCSALARSECASPSLRCDAYHRSFVKGCMTKIGVPPEFTFVLMN